MLTSDDLERVRAQLTTKDKMIMLLNIIAEKKDQNVYKALNKALAKACPWIQEKFDNVDVDDGVSNCKLFGSKVTY